MRSQLFHRRNGPDCESVAGLCKLKFGPNAEELLDGLGLAHQDCHSVAAPLGDDKDRLGAGNDMQTGGCLRVN